MLRAYSLIFLLLGTWSNTSSAAIKLRNLATSTMAQLQKNPKKTAIATVATAGGLYLAYGYLMSQRQELTVGFDPKASTFELCLAEKRSYNPYWIGLADWCKFDPHYSTKDSLDFLIGNTTQYSVQITLVLTSADSNKVHNFLKNAFPFSFSHIKAPGKELQLELAGTGAQIKKLIAEIKTHKSKPHLRLALKEDLTLAATSNWLSLAGCTLPDGIALHLHDNSTPDLCAPLS